MVKECLKVDFVGKIRFSTHFFGTALELVAGALAGRPGRPVIFLMTGQSAPTILEVNLPKYRMTSQNFRGSSQNFRTFGGLFHGFGYLTPLHGLKIIGRPANRPMAEILGRPGRRLIWSSATSSTNLRRISEK